MKIIDMHAHIYPQKIAERASEAIGNFYDIPMSHDGTVDKLLESGTQAGIDMFVVHSVATDPKQVETVNDYIAQTVAEHPQKLLGFAAMHPDYTDIEKEVSRVEKMGLKGIKIHPDFQKFHVDGKEAFRIYEAIEGRLPILIHTGDYRYNYSKAKSVLKALKRFPRLQVICAHFGGWSEWEEGIATLAGTTAMVDTSSSLYALKPGEAKKLIEEIGVDKVLFGTDYPMWDPAEELARFGQIGLTAEERDKILHQNAERLLGL